MAQNGDRIMALAAYVTAADAELMELISALRFLHTAISCGVLTRSSRPGAVDADYIKAKARSQLWTGLSRRHATMQQEDRAIGKLRHEAANGEPTDRPAKQANGTTTSAAMTMTTTTTTTTT